jgi:hypothetical protein
VAKRRKSDPARTRPLTVEFLRDLGALKDFAPPTERFEPNGAWTGAYRLWLVQQWSGGGSLRIRREPMDDRGVRLHVELAVAESAGCLRRTRAVLDCASDALCTPKAWKLTSDSLDLDDKPIAGTALSETGTVADGRLEVRFGGRSRTAKLPQPWTSNWSVFDAVQRLPAGRPKPLKFALLEEMDLLKPDQRLEFREEKQIELNGRTLRLRGYHQIGRGVLPWLYWVDESGRLLLAYSGVRAFLYDAKAEQWTQEKLRRARDRARRRRRNQ